MNETANILPRRHRLRFIARLMCLVVAVLFFYGQVLGASYTHDHSDESPEHSSCEVCILAVEDDNYFDLTVEVNDDPDVSVIWTQLDKLALPEPGLAPGVKSTHRSVDPPPEPRQRPSAARAPPLLLKI